MEKLQNDADKKKIDFEKQQRELIKQSSELQTLLGTDRAYRRYIKMSFLPGLFVENDEKNPGLCMDKIVMQKPELIDADHANTVTYVRKLMEENGSDKENENTKKSPVKINGTRAPVKLLENDLHSTRELLMCTGNNLPCPVHSGDGKPEWLFYHTKEQLQELTSSLNKRGIRESELRQVLESDREPLEAMLEKANPSKLNPSIEALIEEKPVSKKVQSMYTRYEDSNLGYPADVEISEVQHLSLIDNILEMEEKIVSGCLGELKVKDRKAWRENLMNRKYDMLDKTLVKKEEFNQIEKIKSEGNIRSISSCAFL